MKQKQIQQKQTNMQGIIIKNISNDYVVKTEDKLYTCKARGKFRKERTIPLVGDNCIFDDQKKYKDKLTDVINDS